MADWVHCNKCYSRFSSSIKFYVTTCGHLACEKCTSKNVGNTCPVCKTPCDLIVLNNDLKPEMQMFFRPQSETIEKTKQIFMFQEYNKSALLKNINEKYIYTKNELMKCYKALQDAKKEITKLKTLIKNLRGHNLTPMPNSSGPMFSSPSQSGVSSSYSHMHNPQNSTPFMYPPNQRSIIPWSSNNAAQMMMHRRQPNPNNSFALSFQTSLPDCTLDSSLGSMADQSVLNRRTSRPSAMTSITNLNLGVKKQPR